MILENAETTNAVAVEERRVNSPLQLLSRDEIDAEYNLPKRWLELAALEGSGPPMIRISRRMVRYQRGEFESWLEARKVQSISQSVEAAA